MSLFKSATSSAPAAPPPASSGPTVTPAVPPVVPQGNPADLTLDQVRQAVPATHRSAVTQQLVDDLNNLAADPMHAEAIKENFVSYSGILKEGRFKLDEYLNAVSYVSFKIMGYSNQDAYARTFPSRYATLVAKGTTPKDISAYVSAYNKGKLVNLIYEQTLVPTWVLNQHLHQQALNVAAEIMNDASVSPKTRVEAAGTILTHLTKPKEGTFQINIGEVENSGMKELRNLMEEVALNQRTAIASGKIRTIDVAAQRLPVDEDK